MEKRHDAALERRRTRTVPRSVRSSRARRARDEPTYMRRALLLRAAIIECDIRGLALLFLQVTFQVRAPQAGTVKSIAVSNGDTLPIGAQILTLELSGAGAAAPMSAPAAAAPSSPSPPPAATPTASAAAAAAAAHASDAGGRVASIHFRFGKRDAAPAHGAPAAAVRPTAPAPPNKAAAGASAASPALPTFAPSKAGGRTFLDLPPAYGRPALEPREMASIDSGGAF